MVRSILVYVCLFLPAVPALGQEADGSGDKVISGMSIVGNHESPKSLVIVPWKSSELGTRLDVSKIVDDGRQPVDKDVFMRELDYYRISTE
jgi:hypothetical protein